MKQPHQSDSEWTPTGGRGSVLRLYQTPEVAAEYINLKKCPFLTKCRARPQSKPGYLIFTFVNGYLLAFVRIQIDPGVV
jgi:hypothetical protein